MKQSDFTPWYRQFWPWMIIGILGWGVVSSAITLTVAVRNPPQMMDGDYRPLGKLLVDTHQRADRAERLGLSARVALGQDRWRLELAAIDAAAIDDTLLLLVRHPVDSARDRQVLLRRETDGLFGAPATPVPARGRLILTDAAQTWWISGLFEAADQRRLAATLAPERL